MDVSAMHRKQVALNGHGLPDGFANGFEGVRSTSSTTSSDQRNRPPSRRDDNRGIFPVRSHTRAIPDRPASDVLRAD